MLYLANVYCIVEYLLYIYYQMYVNIMCIHIIYLLCNVVELCVCSGTRISI